MSNASRVGDRTWGFCDDDHKCCPHSRKGECSRGSPNVFINGRAAFRQYDVGECNCAHSGQFQSISMSATVFINGKGATRKGDSTMCKKCGECGVISQGSADVFIGD